MEIKIPTMAELSAKGEQADVLFWVGCAGSFDDRYKAVTRAFVEILNKIGIKFAVLGEEETCNGDPARRSGNELLFQIQALTVIQTLESYNVKRIVTACPHCFNTFKNEYPDLGGHYEVLHHSQFLQQLLDSGQLKVQGGTFQGKKITFHDPCYLGRANGVFEAPRSLISALDASLFEMKRNKQKGFCCGAGGAQIFKESEKGNKEVHYERTEEALATGADTIAVGCPFCMTMLSDGIKFHNKENEVQVKDIAELLNQVVLVNG